MKRIFTTLAIALMGLFAQSATTLTVGDGEAVEVYAPGKVAAVRVISSVATGTATLKAAAQMPVVSNVANYASTTNFTYTYVYTNGTATVTNTVDYLPLPLGPTVTAYVTNSIVTTVTNLVPTATSAVVVTNALSDAMTCSGGTASSTPSGKYVYPGDLLFFEGTARGRADVIIED